MELVSYLKILRRRWPLVALIVVLAGTIAWVSTPDPVEVEEQRSYEATHTLFRDPGGGHSSSLTLDTVAMLATTGEVPERVAAQMDTDLSPAELAGQVSVTPTREVGTVAVTVTSLDRDEAASLADAFATETLAYIDEREQVRRQAAVERISMQAEELQTEIAELDEQLAGLVATSTDAELLRAERDALIRRYGYAAEQVREAMAAQSETGGSGFVSLQTAQPVAVTSGGFVSATNAGPRTLLGLALGLLLGLGLAVLLDRLDTRLRSRRDAQGAFRLPVVAEIPRIPVWGRNGVAVIDRPASFEAESFRFLRMSVMSGGRWQPTISSPGNGRWVPVVARRVEDDPTQPVEVILVTSPSPQEGKTTTVANLAAAYAESGKKVLVIDLDFRHPEQHRLFGVGRSPGMTDYLRRTRSRPPLESLIQASDTKNIDVLSNGTFAENPGELRQLDPAFIEQARKYADVVIIDAGPLLSVNEPAALVCHVDAVCLVARASKTTYAAAAQATDLLARQGAPVIGTVLIGVSRHESGQPYYYAQVRSAPADTNILNRLGLNSPRGTSSKRTGAQVTSRKD